MLPTLALLGACLRDDGDEAPTGTAAAASSVEDGYIYDRPNLLENGGLEQWVITDYHQPEGWNKHKNLNVVQDSIVVFEGNYSARMESQKSGSTARIDQKIPVTPGSRIRIRFSYFVEKWKKSGARTYCYFREQSTESSNIPASELQELYTNDEYHIIRGGGLGKTYLPHELGVWQTFDEAITVPPTATWFEFGVNSYFGTTIYVDDCHVIEGRTEEMPLGGDD